MESRAQELVRQEAAMTAPKRRAVGETDTLYALVRLTRKEAIEVEQYQKGDYGDDAIYDEVHERLNESIRRALSGEGEARLATYCDLCTQFDCDCLVVADEGDVNVAEHQVAGVWLPLPSEDAP